MSVVLVLNATYEPISRTRLARAVAMLREGVAVVEEAVPGKFLRFASGAVPLPRVLRLVKYVRVTTAHRIAGWSRRGVLARDASRCAYCGGPGTTIDHIVPRARGGRSEWLNTVAACGTCNNRKGSGTPEDIGLHLMVQPWQPSSSQLALLLHQPET